MNKLAFYNCILAYRELLDVKSIVLNLLRLLTRFFNIPRKGISCLHNLAIHPVHNRACMYTYIERLVDTSASIGGVTKLQAAACVPVEKIPHGRKSRYDGISQ